MQNWSSSTNFYTSNKIFKKTLKFAKYKLQLNNEAVPFELQYIETDGARQTKI